jgi:hypothetical protein
MNVDITSSNIQYMLLWIVPNKHFVLYGPHFLG